jgi:micrococcal nuclease
LTPFVPYKRKFSRTAINWFPPLLLTLVRVDPGFAWAWSGKVIGVIDGDSITMLHDGRQEQIRLWGIDCPEKRQDFGSKAKQAASDY